MSSSTVQPPVKIDAVMDRPQGIDRSQVAVIIPTYRAAHHWADLTTSLAHQGIPPKQILIVDSESKDSTVELANAAGFLLLRIAKCDFNHGATRQLAARHLPWARVVIYLTQDALPLPGAIDILLQAFDDPAVGAAYGRQLPRIGAGILEAHARSFNYPAHSSVRTFESRHQDGFRAAFFSNSFGAYRIEALDQAGGFPCDAILAEDSVAVGRILTFGWKVAYVAEAQAYHSHSFTLEHEFRRYFDIGVCHAREHWLLERFGDTRSEGLRFVLSEMRTVIPRHMHLIPMSLLRSAAKLIGYKLGRHESAIGKRWCKRLSYHTSYWDSAANVRHT
jgi:rhamnosyltransferase